MWRLPFALRLTCRSIKRFDPCRRQFRIPGRRYPFFSAGKTGVVSIKIHRVLARRWDGGLMLVSQDFRGNSLNITT